MASFLRILLFKPVMWAAKKFSSRPGKERVFAALTNLYKNIIDDPGKKGLVIPFDLHTGKFIIFSDQHKGRRNGADDFKDAEPNYLAALEYYFQEGFTFINLGDSEELWENNLWQVKKHNKETFEAEKKFLNGGRYIKLYGNHDLFWDNDPLAGWQLKNIYDQKVKVYEGVVLKLRAGSLEAGVKAYNPKLQTHNSELTLFLTHGHQGDASSDGNWFSKFFVAKIWAPLQSLLKINPNTPAYDAERKTLHNNMMYEWSVEQKDLLLITGHTHQPVFASLTHLERLYKEQQMAIYKKDGEKAKMIKAEIGKIERNFTSVSVDYMSMEPTYFNSGCCCFNDGDITGIEIANGYIRLIKWSACNGRREPIELEKMLLEELMDTNGTSFYID